MSEQRYGSLVEPLADEGPPEGICPQCGQQLPTGFATGTRSLCPDPQVRYADAVPDADGPTGYEVITRLARGEQALDICRDMDLTLAQVEGLRPYIGTARNIKVGERT